MTKFKKNKLSKCKKSKTSHTNNSKNHSKLESSNYSESYKDPKYLAEALSNPDEKVRYEAIIFISNFFLNSTSKYAFISTFLDDSVIQALSLRLVDNIKHIKIAAAGALRNIVSHNDENLIKAIVVHDIFPSLIILLSQDIINQQNDENEFYIQLVNALINICANSDKLYNRIDSIDPNFITNLIHKVCLASFDESDDGLMEMYTNLVFVMSDHNVSISQFIAESQNFHLFLSNLKSALTSCLATNNFPSATLLYRVGIIIHLWSSQIPSFDDIPIENFVLYLILILNKINTSLLNDKAEEVGDILSKSILVSEFISNILAHLDDEKIMNSQKRKISSELFAMEKNWKENSIKKDGKIFVSLTLKEGDFVSSFMGCVFKTCFFDLVHMLQLLIDKNSTNSLFFLTVNEFEEGLENENIDICYKYYDRILSLIVNMLESNQFINKEADLGIIFKFCIFLESKCSGTHYMNSNGRTELQNTIYSTLNLTTQIYTMNHPKSFPGLFIEQSIELQKLLVNGIMHGKNEIYRNCLSIVSSIAGVYDDNLLKTLSSLSKASYLEYFEVKSKLFFFLLIIYRDIYSYLHRAYPIIYLKKSIVLSIAWRRKVLWKLKLYYVKQI